MNTQEAEFVFDPVKHEYRLNGVEIPSTTRLIKSAGLVDESYFSEWFGTRGSYIHKATVLLENGTLDWDTVDPQIAGYLEAYKRFLQETRFQSLAVEEPRYHPLYRFAGTPDRVGYQDGKPIIYDIKAGVPQEWHSLQLAGYNLLVKTPLIPVYHRRSLYLSKDGAYKIKEFNDRNDEQVFLACLTLFNWRKKCL